VVITTASEKIVEFIVYRFKHRKCRK